MRSIRERFQIVDGATRVCQRLDLFLLSLENVDVSVKFQNIEEHDLRVDIH